MEIYGRNSAEGMACSDGVRGRRDRNKRERNGEEEKEEGDEKGRDRGGKMLEKERGRGKGEAEKGKGEGDTMQIEKCRERDMIECGQLEMRWKCDTCEHSHHKM